MKLLVVVVGPGDLKALTFGVEGLGLRVSGRAGIMKMRVLRRPCDYVGAQFLKERPKVCRKLTNRCQGKQPLQKRSELNPNSTKISENGMERPIRHLWHPCKF